MSDSVTQNARDLFRFLLKESDIVRSALFIYVVVASATRTGLIYLINETAESGPSWVMVLAILAVTATMLTSTHLATMSGVRLVQGLARKMRLRMTGMLLRADVSFFQNRDPGMIHMNATHHADSVANAAMRIADIVQAALLLIFVLGYMLWQMPTSVLATVIALSLGVTAFFLNEGPATRAVRKSHEARGALHNSLNDLMRGYKELRLRRTRRAGLSDQLETEISSLKGLTEVAERHYSFGNISASGALAALLISVVVIIPLISGADSVTILQILTLVLFSFAPIEAMISGLPAIARAGVCFRIYQDFTRELSENAEVPDVAREDRHHSFDTIELRGAEVHLTRDVGDDSKAQDSFTLGPIDLVLRPGQSVFITGGNGMGKSTLLSLLTGLRHPDAGEILIDGTPVTRDNVSDYRSVFAVVFSEFYLFQKLYGMTEDEIEDLRGHIGEMGLGDGVVIEDGGFTNLSLSTGQRRRLALSIALTERRPILVLDEFAADQDPVRRKFFYDVLVPRLAAAGHCVVAVTHDEHCFGAADRLIRMEDGKIVADVEQVARATA